MEYISILTLVISGFVVGMNYERKQITDKVIKTSTDQVEYYGDICAESSSGYEDMSGKDAYFEGVKCAAEAIKGSVK